MIVAADACLGTIGGGRLEYEAIAAARDLLADGAGSRDMAVALGPDLGQCCGGRVSLSLVRLDASARAAAVKRARQTAAALPHVLIMGAGHVGRALARHLQHLPLACTVVDDRAEQIASVDAAVQTRLTALPEAEITGAPAGAAFVVLTHDHALDFLLATAALERRDARYVGLVGSATKRARFESWHRDRAAGSNLDGLTCPIGTAAGSDKRPEAIAVATAAEVMAALAGRSEAGAKGMASDG
jgi:xanthine dehydrogenase accessory factor